MTQQRNAEMVDLLRADFQARYEPNFAWKSACSVFQALTGLRGFWPMSGVGAGLATDFGGLAHHLTNNNICLFNYDDLAPYVEFDGVNQYLSHLDHADFDILGTETYFDADIRGLTLGGWFWFDDPAAAEENMITKRTAAGNLSYYLRRQAAGTANFEISSDCTAVVSVTSTDTLDDDIWYFIVGRFDPSAELKIWVNDATDTNVAAIPASLCNSNAPLAIGATGVPGAYMDGRASLNFLCASMLSDAIINALFQQTRAMYGV